MTQRSHRASTPISPHLVRAIFDGGSTVRSSCTSMARSGTTSAREVRHLRKKPRCGGTSRTTFDDSPLSNLSGRESCTDVRIMRRMGSRATRSELVQALSQGAERLRQGADLAWRTATGLARSIRSKTQQMRSDRWARQYAEAEREAAVRRFYASIGMTDPFQRRRRGTR